MLTTTFLVISQVQLYMDQPTSQYWTTGQDMEYVKHAQTKQRYQILLIDYHCN